jgi:hypothetical protein
VIHNVGVGYREPRRIATADGLPHVFAVNVMAPYVLTALMERPQRLVYLSSGMHHDANAHLDDVLWEKRRWNGSEARASGSYFFHLRLRAANPQALEVGLQDRLVALCAEISGIALPGVAPARASP